MQRMIAEQEPERPPLRVSTLSGDQQTIISTGRGQAPQFLIEGPYLCG
jgi:hypothetical protein